MTEKQGGSDVRANTTAARPLERRRARRRVRDHRPQVVLLGADVRRVPRPRPDRRGLSCFLLPRFTPDGERNRFHIQRLKDKLGNRSNASSEVEFRGAWARMVGEEGRGVATIIEMVNHTRLDCAIGSPRGCGPASPQATHHAAHRAAFGKLLVDQPLMQNVLADLGVESEAATVSSMRLARAYDEATAGDEEAAVQAAGQRRAQVLDLQARPLARGRGLECLGGNGYVEESGMPRLFRESPLNSIWEGSGNVQCLDVLRAMVKSPASVDAFFAEVARGRGAEPRLDAYADALREEIASDLETLEPRARRSSSGWRSRSRARCWSATATRPSPTPSAPPASTATGAGPSAPCRRHGLRAGSSSATARSSDTRPAVGADLSAAI